LQSFTDEFKLPGGDFPITPAVSGHVLRQEIQSLQVDMNEQRIYRSGTGKLLHMMKWSRPDNLNPVRDLSRFMKVASGAHMAAMYQVRKYSVGTPNRGLVLKPNATWDGNPNFEFVTEGVSSSDFAKNPDTRCSVSGYAVFLWGVPVVMKSNMQLCITLSVTDAKLVSATSCAQHMLYAM